MFSKSNWLIAIVLLLIGGFYVGKYLYMKPKHVNGEQAPNFTATTMQAEPFDLAKLRGKLVLLDFWGSWCGPCIAEMPGLKSLYEKYKDSSFENAQGFEIVGIGIEEDAQRWRAAIERLQLPWRYQIMDQNTSLRFFDGQIAQLFGVRQVPSTFLLNEKGDIMGVNLSPDEMDKLLGKRLR
jgi:thiol-disulfide isomerase/thioredoxin